MTLTTSSAAWRSRASPIASVSATGWSTVCGNDPPDRSPRRRAHGRIPVTGWRAGDVGRVHAVVDGMTQAKAGAPAVRSAARRGRVLDDERGDHPEHAVLALGVREDVAVERPRAGLVAVDDDVPALARVDAQRVARELGADPSG